MDTRPQVVSSTPSRQVALFRRVFGPIMMRVGIFAVLEVPGRRTGTPLHLTLAVWEVEGNTYLLSLYGVSEWVRNLRAAGGGELRRKGRTEAFTAIEVDGDERDRIIAAFYAKADRWLKKDFDRLPGAADHPTFRVEPIRSRTGSTDSPES
jgi:deazaflavin-dependent oxidoreductase (nitroreductase family)